MDDFPSRIVAEATQQFGQLRLGQQDMVTEVTEGSAAPEVAPADRHQPGPVRAADTTDYRAELAARTQQGCVARARRW
jgi:hypothetical protein